VSKARPALGPYLICAALMLIGSVAWLHSRTAPAHVATAKWETHFKPANLKVLPKSISAAEIKNVMHRYDQALGVTCDYCHVENEDSRQLDYASDDNPKKQSARVMMTMLDDINDKYLAQLGVGDYSTPITCGNCHQGQTSPPDFDARPHATPSGAHAQ
jgi:hypothetical protein